MCACAQVVCMCAHAQVCLHVCMCVRACTCVFVRVHVHVHMCARACRRMWQWCGWGRIICFLFTCSQFCNVVFRLLVQKQGLIQQYVVLGESFIQLTLSYTISTIKAVSGKTIHTLHTLHTSEMILDVENLIHKIVESQFNKLCAFSNKN